MVARSMPFLQFRLRPLLDYFGPDAAPVANASVANDPYATSWLVWVTLPLACRISTDPIARTRQSIAQARTAISARRDASGTVCFCMGPGRALRLKNR